MEETNLFDELVDIICSTPMNCATKKITEWYKKHEKEPILKTEDGIKLRKHLNDMLTNEAMIWFDMSKIEMNLFRKWREEHPEEVFSEQEESLFSRLEEYL